MYVATVTLAPCCRIGSLTLHSTVLKVGRVAIITRGRYAGKKVRRKPNPYATDHHRERLCNF